MYGTEEPMPSEPATDETFTIAPRAAFKAAAQAREKLPPSLARIDVVDTHSASLGVGLTVIAAAQMAQEIPHSQRLRASQLKPGDLLFFGTAHFNSRATEENVIVLTPEGVKNGPLRFGDEFVRHKVLDLIGDFALLGMYPRFEVIALKSGHALHVAAAISAGATEFVTTERRDKPIHRVRAIQVVTIYPAAEA